MRKAGPLWEGEGREGAWHYGCSYCGAQADQHDDLLFATCLGVWAWENAIAKQDCISYLGEWELEGGPINVLGKPR
jgi:hypothetical protein